MRDTRMTSPTPSEEAVRKAEEIADAYYAKDCERSYGGGRDDLVNGIALSLHEKDLEIERLTEECAHREMETFSAKRALVACKARVEAMREVVFEAGKVAYKFRALREDCHNKLVKGQTLESASENWGAIGFQDIEFGPLLEALSKFDAVERKTDA